MEKLQYKISNENRVSKIDFLWNQFISTSRHKGLTFRGIIFFVGLLTLFSGFYFLIIASDMYISECMFAIRNADNSITGGAGNSSTGTAMLLQAFGSTNAEAYIVRDYIHSHDLLNHVNKRLQIREHFSSNSHDFISRLNHDATMEQFLKYWVFTVSLSFDPEAGIIRLKTKGYSPEMAQKINKIILEKSEELINRMNERARQDILAQAYRELRLAEEQILLTREALRIFRDDHFMLDPNSTADGLGKLIDQLEMEKAKISQQLAESLSYMRVQSPHVVAIQNKLKTIEDQIITQKHRLVGTGQRDERINTVIGEYEKLTTDAEFAQKRYLNILTSLEISRIKADSKLLYIVPFQLPTLPDESLYPRPFLFTFLVSILSLLTLGLLSLIVGAVREHAGF
ncbi:MAG: capsule biosynthesis protein [Deltaproteobacteria bacterium]|nr:capsule biosynthesis protein [Deltaproteobacteria bacterium]